ncbi:PAS domain-containing protein [Clostridium sp. P21]|uniref:PAS domain-containing protein n=1 Tax=Clostridium muellerianum TaxID=2716538 RepID=A0A7Y0EJI9_9CLOT|nr:PAS domain-containing protein [Clostridium muellerianum]NMM64643.1 PAS domain-containing protein [Clostridium muellerianum]
MVLDSKCSCLFSNNSNIKPILNKRFSKNNNTINSVINTIPIGIIILDSKFNVVIWNPAQEKISNVCSKSAIGENVFNIFPKILSKNIEVKIKNVVQNKETIVLNNFRINRFFLNKYYNIKISPLENESLIVHNIIITIEDCTMLHNIKYELENTSKILKKRI